VRFACLPTGDLDPWAKLTTAGRREAIVETALFAHDEQDRRANSHRPACPLQALLAQGLTRGRDHSRSRRGYRRAEVSARGSGRAHRGGSWDR